MIRTPFLLSEKLITALKKTFDFCDFYLNGNGGL